MTLPFMSPERQYELSKIATEVIDTVSSEFVSPTDALHKVAVDQQLNEHEIRRIAEAYNASAQLALMKRAKEDESVEPDDVIDLADGEEVVGRLFKIDGAEGDKKDDVVDPGEYSADALLKVAEEILPEERSFDEPIAFVAPMRKTASAAVGRTIERSADEEIDYLIKQAEDQICQLRSRHSVIADEAAAHKITALRGMEKLAEALRRTDAPDFCEIEKHAKSFHEGMGVVCDMIYDGCGLAKIGHSRFTGNLPKYASVTEHADYVQDCLVVRDNLAKAAAKYAEADDLLTQIEKAQYRLRKLALDPMTMLATGMNKLDETEKDVQATSMPAGKPNEMLRSQLQGDRMRVALMDLTQNDPVIKEYAKDPGKIEEAFNEILSLQPGLVDQPVALRAALRRHLTAGGDFTVQEAQQVAQFPTQQPNRSATV